jgi:cytoskeletal protein RodZ
MRNADFTKCCAKVKMRLPKPRSGAILGGVCEDSHQIDTPPPPAYIRLDHRSIKNKNMSMDSFGETLKRERELRGVTLDEISLATRIATRFLKAIEEERWDDLPGGVFNRGFVRAMARYIGLDEEDTVAEYVLAIGDRATAPVVPPGPPVVTPQRPWLAWILVAVVVVSVVVTCWIGVRRLMMWRASRQASHRAMVNSAGEPSPSESPRLGAAPAK